MSLKNTQTRYGSVARFFHWSIALSIITLIPLGIIADDMAYDTSELLARKAFLFQIHKTFGVLVFFLALARITWAITQPKPANLHPERKLESFMAELVHWLLYGSLVLVPLTGWIHHAATTGFAPILWPFGQDLPFVAKSESTAELFSILHKTFERVLVVSLLLHIAGAVKHHVIDKDVTLTRMLGRAEGGHPHKAKHNLAAPFAALAVWALALPAGMAFFHDPHAHATQAVPAVELTETQGNWEVTGGNLEISVTQFGSAVTGNFADWNAEINFTDDRSLPVMGSVDVEIAIASLTLGSVTDQAMGADFFDAAQFPVARFTGDIIPVLDGYAADGTLTLKGIEQPLRFNFDLSITDDEAEMASRFELMRLDFGIGASMQDESSLSFPVEVTVSLTATQN